MRNFFAHNYMQMDTRLIWLTAINDIPKVKVFCENKISESTKTFSDDTDDITI
ncbi:MAG: DUF86 domain-containing protein [Clostridia bacterium]|nr:DUF86 domain-containing protein [Clostridia bacterium]